MQYPIMQLLNPFRCKPLDTADFGLWYQFWSSANISYSLFFTSADSDTALLLAVASWFVCVSSCIAAVPFFMFIRLQTKRAYPHRKTISISSTGKGAILLEEKR